MCIILTCESNVRPNNDLIETCFLNNPDGAGIMWVQDGMVQTSKGYMEIGSLERAIAAVPDESPLVIHMRIATSGGIDVGTCHPYPITSNIDVLHAPDTECAAAVAHNGVIKGMPTDDRNGISDTISFVSGVLTPMFRGSVTRRVRKRVIANAPGNRFAILTKDGTVSRIGDGWETVTYGIQASNSTWRFNKDFWLSSYDYKDDYYEDYYDFWLEDEIDQHCNGCDKYGSCVAYGAMCTDVADLMDEWMRRQDEMEEDWARYEREMDGEWEFQVVA